MDENIDVKNNGFDEIIKKMIHDEVSSQMNLQNEKDIDEEAKRLKEEIDMVISREVKKHLSDACSMLINKFNAKF